MDTSDMTSSEKKDVQAALQASEGGGSHAGDSTWHKITSELLFRPHRREKSPPALYMIEALWGSRWLGACRKGSRANTIFSVIADKPPLSTNARSAWKERSRDIS